MIWRGGAPVASKQSQFLHPQKTRITPLWRERTSLESTGKTTAFTRTVLLPSHKDTTFLSHVFSLKQCFPVESHRLPIRSEAMTTASDMTCCGNNACKPGCQIRSRSESTKIIQFNYNGGTFPPYKATLLTLFLCKLHINKFRKRYVSVLLVEVCCKNIFRVMRFSFDLVENLIKTDWAEWLIWLSWFSFSQHSMGQTRVGCRPLQAGPKVTPEMTIKYSFRYCADNGTKYTAEAATPS